MIKFLFVCSVLLAIPTPAQHPDLSYLQIRSKYEKMQTDDERAMPWVKKYITNAKILRNDKELVQAYRDAVQYSPAVTAKLMYADSTITAAKRTNDPALISNAYLGRGIVYYFNYKKFKNALDQYLIAEKYAAKTEDGYLKYKILYHIGVLRSYLGYDEEAAENFQDCITFYRKQISESTHPVTLFNSTRAMLNAMHRLSVCYGHMDKLREEELIITEGLKLSEDDPDFTLEFAYFMKGKGIVEYRKGNYNDAVWYLKTSLTQIKRRNDFAWLSVISFYLGEIYRKNGDTVKALKCFKKIDSLYIQYDFILPEVSPAYDRMIEFYQKENQEKKALYYAVQLQKAERSMRRDFSYLGSKISREYDRKNFQAEKKQLQKTNIWGRIVAVVLIIITVILAAVMFWRRKREKVLVERYRILKEKWSLQQADDDEHSHSNQQNTKKSPRLKDHHYLELEKKLKNFEEKKRFLKKGITVDSAAKMLGTNENYLSIFINETKGMKFPKYMDELRIAEIIRLFDENPKMMKYMMQTLADEVGFSTRQKFTNTFHKVTGLTLQEYAALRKKDEHKDTEN